VGPHTDAWPGNVRRPTSCLALSSSMSQPDRAPTEDVDDNAQAPDGWWVRSVRAAPSAIPRRAALQGILAVGGVIVAAGVDIPEAAAQDDSLPVRTETRRALEMQRQYGWSFGAAAERLTFDGAAVALFERSALARMPDELRPARLRHVPFYVPTLFQSPTAPQRAVPAGDAGAVVPLGDALWPIFTPAMGIAYQRGKALAAQFHNVWSKAAVVVDLPGPEAVAFAAGAAEVLDPVFLFDNWPHPRGVVPAHLTLAAAAYYQPLFARRAAPPGAPPMFVLDRDRLAPYTDDAEQFDNRYVARMPSASALRAIDVERVLYVAPTAADSTELDDLNDEFIFYAAAGLDVKIVAADAFGPGPGGPELRPLPVVTPSGVVIREEEQRRYYYGGSDLTDGFFWIDYPWLTVNPHTHGKMPVAPPFPRPGTRYAPAARVTAHGGGMHPLDFGHVKVVVSARTGAILGAALSRSGSWNRTLSSGSGG
jgi:hypothetical protein